MKILYSLKQKGVFNLNYLKCFHGYAIPLVKILHTVNLVLCLAISFQEKYQEFKIFVVKSLDTGQQQNLYLKYMFQVRKNKNEANQLSHQIVKHGQFMMQFFLT